MRTTFLAALLFVSALALGGQTAEESRDFIVVVHEDNPVESVPKDELARMFMKRETRWEGWKGVRVEPVNQRTTSPVREEFTAEVHGLKLSKIKSYWQRMIFSGRDAPPVEKDSDDEVLQFLRENLGGVGYVSSETDLGEGVRELTVEY